MKYRLHRYDINRHKSRHGHKYIKNKKCSSVITVTCIKQHITGIWRSINEKVKKALLAKISVAY